MLLGATMLERTNSIDNDDEDVRKEEEDKEDSPLHSVITNSNIQKEEKYFKGSLTSPNKNVIKACQIDTNEKISLEELEARKSLLSIHSSQVGYKTYTMFDSIFKRYELNLFN